MSPFGTDKHASPVSDMQTVSLHVTIALLLAIDRQSLHYLSSLPSHPLTPPRMQVPMRKEEEWTLAANRQLVTGAGWLYCSLPKDIWLCWGEECRQHLLHSRQLHQQAAISRFPPGSRVFLQGNSHFAESIVSLVSGTHYPSDCVHWSRPMHSSSIVSFSFSL